MSNLEGVGVQDLPVTFRPRLARVWASAIGALVAFACIVMAIGLPWIGSHWTNSLGFLLFGAPIVWFCYRQASVRVRAEVSYVEVRGLFSTRRFEWAELFAVTFPQGEPWAHLDLTDGESMSLMAFQRADGPHGIREAQRFSNLIDRYASIEPPGSA